MKRNLNFILLWALFAYLAIPSTLALHRIAWGSGAWLGEFSPLWALIFFSYAAACLLFALFLALLFWRGERLTPALTRFARWREARGALRYPLAALILFLPIWLLQYSGWGLVFRDFSLRRMMALAALLALSFLFTRGDKLMRWQSFLFALATLAAAFVAAAALTFVSDYPFSLSWSEGNRLWDYSLMFGRARYFYPPQKDIPVLLEVGRQFFGGLIFLWDAAPIQFARIWVGLLQFFPYLLLGLALFRAHAKQTSLWAALAFYVLIFLKQGPIHPPLVFSAVLVALAWGTALPLASLLLFAAVFIVQVSRWTWIFAPILWLLMLEFGGADFDSAAQTRRVWRRSIALGVAGILSIALIMGWMAFSPAAADALTNTIYVEAHPPAAQPAASISIVEYAVNVLANQPLLWYRLLPNSTYKSGILVSLLIAIAPLVLLLFGFMRRRAWNLTAWQKVVLSLPMLAFLIVGLVASTKIGGGGDLHNLDMFLIALVFLSALAWKHGGQNWILNPAQISTPQKWILVLLLILPASISLRDIRPLYVPGDVTWIAKLTDRRHVEDVPILPSPQTAEAALQDIRAQVAEAQSRGEVLFLDQRQLLTFGYIADLPLIPEYEKKTLMNEAMGDNARYFQPFYADLQAQRFALIISEPIRQPAKDRSAHFGEENNAWVKWVSLPMLCYYEEKDFFKEVGAQLLAPIPNPPECDFISQGSQP